MKKITTILFIALISLQLSAQTTLTTAVDFTATDVNGNTFNLFSTLASGKYVMLDFMFTTCGPCQLCAPKLYGGFTNYGCNTPSAQIEFVSINRDDNNAVMHSWESTYMNATGPYPRGISGTEGSSTAGAQTFHTLYGISAFPTMILIAPSHAILEQDMWPITDASTFTTYFQAHGLNPMSCLAGINTLESGVNAVSLSPVPAANQLNISSSQNNIKEIKVLNMLGEVMIAKVCANNIKSETIDISALADGIYFAEMKLNDTSVLTKKFIVANSSR